MIALYNIISWVNIIGFSIAGVMLWSLVFSYERPTYLDNYFYLSFTAIVLGILTNYYQIKTHNTDWFLKIFPFIVWFKLIRFCIDIKKVSFKISLTEKEKLQRILNRNAATKLFTGFLKKHFKL